jgi:hypothetical protein
MGSGHPPPSSKGRSTPIPRASRCERSPVAASSAAPRHVHPRHARGPPHSWMARSAARGAHRLGGSRAAASRQKQRRGPDPPALSQRTPRAGCRASDLRRSFDDEASPQDHQPKLVRVGRGSARTPMAQARRSTSAPRHSDTATASSLAHPPGQRRAGRGGIRSLALSPDCGGRPTAGALTVGPTATSAPRLRAPGSGGTVTPCHRHSGNP